MLVTLLDQIRPLELHSRCQLAYYTLFKEICYSETKLRRLVN